MHQSIHDTQHTPRVPSLSDVCQPLIQIIKKSFSILVKRWRLGGMHVLHDIGRSNHNLTRGASMNGGEFSLNSIKINEVSGMPC